MVVHFSLIITIIKQHGMIPAEEENNRHAVIIKVLMNLVRYQRDGNR